MRSVISPFYSDEVVSSGGGGGGIANDYVTSAMLQDELATYVKFDGVVQRKATVNISSVDITTNMITGITIVPAPGAGKVIRLIYGLVRYTYAVAAYTGGASGVLRYGITGSGSIAGTLTTTNYFGATANQIRMLKATTNTLIRSTSGAVYSNASLIFSATSNFTNPGTAAGTAVIEAYYQILDFA